MLRHTVPFVICNRTVCTPQKTPSPPHSPPQTHHHCLFRIIGPSSFAALGTYQCIVVLCQVFIDELEIISERVGCTIALVSISLIQLTMFIGKNTSLFG